MKYVFTDEDKITYTVADTVSELENVDEKEIDLLRCAISVVEEICNAAVIKLSQKGKSLPVPKIEISDSEEQNFLVKGSKHEKGYMYYELIICKGLLCGLDQAITSKYTDDDLDQMGVLPQVERESIRRGVFQYAIRSLALHELVHLWHSHVVWESNYYCMDWNGNPIKGNGRELYFQFKPIVDSIHDNERDLLQQHKEKFLIVMHYNVSHQALEADADRSAASFLTNTIIETMKQMPVHEREGYCTREIALLIAGICVSDYVFSNNSRRKYNFQTLFRDIAEIDHPTPAIRFFMERFQIERLVRKRIKDRQIRDAVVEESNNIINGIEENYARKSGLRNVFYDYAFCPNAQKSIVKIKMRYNCIYQTLKEFSLSELEKPYENGELQVFQDYVLFDDMGTRL